MLELEKLLWEKSKSVRLPTTKEREAAQWLFEHWRDRLIALHSMYIWLCRSAFRFAPSLVDEASAFRMHWSNAAIHLLTVPTETVQDWFLRSTWIEKDKIVKAVLRDGGIQNPSGCFIELPPL